MKSCLNHWRFTALEKVPMFTPASYAAIDAYDGFGKRACIVTDNTRAMVGRKTTLVALLQQNGTDCPIFH